MSQSEFVSRLHARAAALNLTVTDSQARSFEAFYTLLAKWNRRINLTALSLDPVPQSETLDRLFLEPVLASQLVPGDAISIIDLGSGAGSPAIPLKILRPDLSLTMVETKGRKAAFLREAIRTLRLGEVDILQVRFQDLPTDLFEVFDVVTVRALKVDEELVDVADALIEENGRLLLFGLNSPPQGFRVAAQRTLPDSSTVIACTREEA